MTVADMLRYEAPERQIRRQFALPEDDVELLESCGLPWETVVMVENGQRSLWLFVHDVPLPPAIEARDQPGVPLVTATMGFRVTGYPGANLDMVYLNPPLARVSRSPIAALSDFQLDGRIFQQWSRHYPFDPATHTLFGHFRTAQTWLEKEAIQ